MQTVQVEACSSGEKEKAGGSGVGCPRVTGRARGRGRRRRIRSNLVSLKMYWMERMCIPSYTLESLDL